MVVGGGGGNGTDTPQSRAGRVWFGLALVSDSCHSSIGHVMQENAIVYLKHSRPGSHGKLMTAGEVRTSTCRTHGGGMLTHSNPTQRGVSRTTSMGG